MKHFELTDKTMVFLGRTVYRIRALIDIPSQNVKKGDIGGYVESLDNLHHSSWVFDYGIVCDNAKLYENSSVAGTAKVYGRAEMHENAKVYENAIVFDSVIVSGDVKIYGNSTVCGNARLYDKVEVYDRASISGNCIMENRAKAYNCATIKGYATINDYVEVFGHAYISGAAELQDLVRVYDNVTVTNNITLSGDSNISGDTTLNSNFTIKDGFITSDNDICWFANFGSSNRTTAFFYGIDEKIIVTCGCFYGTLDEFEAKVIKTHGDTKYAKEYLTMIKLVEIKFEITPPTSLLEKTEPFPLEYLEDKFYNRPIKDALNINWEQRRYEIAKDILSSYNMNTELVHTDIDKITQFSMKQADNLIKELMNAKPIT